MQEAIAHYHELLTDELAQASDAMLTDQLRRRGLVFGDRPLATVLRPRFMTLDRYRLLQHRVRLLMSAFGKAYERAMADPTFRRQFRLTDWEERLIARETGLAEPSPTSRLDAFVMDEAGTMALTEYNAETPAGAGYNDALVASFADLPIMRAFGRRYEAVPLPARHGVLHVLLDAYEGWAGRRELPRVAIVDWPEVPTRSEFVLFQEYFTAVGIEAVIADPRELELRGGRLYGPGGRVDLVYKRVLLAELVERCGADTPLLQAVATRAVCMVNPPRCKVLHKKASLAVLSDERNQSLFTPGGAGRHRRARALDTYHGGAADRARGSRCGSGAVRRRRAGAHGAEAQRRLRRRGDRAGLDRGRHRPGDRRWRTRSRAPTSSRSGWTFPPSRTPAWWTAAWSSPSG